MARRKWKEEFEDYMDYRYECYGESLEDFQEYIELNKDTLAKLFKKYFQIDKHPYQIKVKVRVKDNLLQIEKIVK